MMSWEGADRAAWGEVRRLGHENVAPCHGLLALLRLEETDPVRRAMEGAGFRLERVEAWVRDVAGGEKNHWNGTTIGWERVAGRAEAFGAALGGGRQRPADLLFALLWDEWVWPWIYYHHGARPDEVLELIARDLAVPSAPLPTPDPGSRIKGTQRLVCPTAAVSRVLEILNERDLGGGVAYGWTIEGDDQAWFVAPDGVPLQAVIDEAVSPAS